MLGIHRGSRRRDDLVPPSPNGQPIAQKTGTTHSYVVIDALGSTTAVLDSSGGSVRSYQYTSDGSDSTSGDGTSTILRYAGGHKTNSGLYHFGAHFYDTTLARWTQPDRLDDTGDRPKEPVPLRWR